MNTLGLMTAILRYAVFCLLATIFAGLVFDTLTSSVSQLNLFHGELGRDMSAGRITVWCYIYIALFPLLWLAAFAALFAVDKRRRAMRA
jgi:hypothetical protein